MKRPVFKFQFHFIQFQELLVLFQNGILRLFQDLHQHLLAQSLQSTDDRQSSNELRDHAELTDILYGHLR